MKVVISSHEPVVADRSGVFCAACRHYDWRCTSVLLLFRKAIFDDERLLRETQGRSDCPSNNRRTPRCTWLIDVYMHECAGPKLNAGTIICVVHDDETCLIYDLRGTN